MWSRRTARSPLCRSALPNSATCTRGIDEAVFSIEPLMEWAERDELAGAEEVPE